MSGNVLVVLDKQSKVGAGSTIAMNGDSIGGFSVSVSGAGNVSARVRLEIANDPGGPWVSDAASIVSLSGICSATTYLRSTTHFEYIRAVVESISAGASVSVFFGDFASSGTGFYQQDNLVFGETNPLTGGINLSSGSIKLGELSPTARAARTVIVDTDFWTDCDDVGALRICTYAEKMGVWAADVAITAFSSVPVPLILGAQVAGGATEPFVGWINEIRIYAETHDDTQSAAVVAEMST